MTASPAEHCVRRHPVRVTRGVGASGLPAKASAADDMTTAFKPIFATQSVQQAAAYTSDVQAMSVEFTQKALPGLATALHMTPAQMSAMMTQAFPAVATGVAQLPTIVQRMRTATGLIGSNVENYNQSASIPWSPGSMVAMFWLMMLPALLVLAVGAGALALTGRSGAASQPLPRLRGAYHH